ncbi:MAG: hypothetical protein HKN90_07920 [Flavobacteriaceae bacterium]|nr:hypothetical protein [Flavobacteriaceae bacterium]
MKPILVLIVLMCSLNLNAQKLVTEHIMTLDNHSNSPKAKLNDVAWFSGNWKGKAFGGTAEEVWSEPFGDSMMAAFKLIKNGKVSFYELEIIREVKESLILQLKHFNNDLKGWETKDETVDFPLVKVTDTIVYFDGMTFEKIGDNEMNVYVLMKQNDGSNKEIIINYKK